MLSLVFTILVFAAGGLFGAILMAILCATRPEPDPSNVRFIIVRSTFPTEQRSLEEQTCPNTG